MSNDQYQASDLQLIDGSGNAIGDPAGYNKNDYFAGTIPSQFSARWFFENYLGADDDGVGLDLIGCEEIFVLSSTKGRFEVAGSLGDAIRQAHRLDDRLQPAFGVDVQWGEKIVASIR